jgi:hypothetical protein
LSLCGIGVVASVAIGRSRRRRTGAA